MGQYVAVVNGAAYRFGLDMVKELAKMDYKVYALTTESAIMCTLTNKIRNVTWIHIDSVDEMKLKRRLAMIDEDYINVLINNAEVTCCGNTTSAESTVLDRTIQTDINGMIYTTRILLPLLERGCNASVINVPARLLQSEVGMIGYEVCDAAIAAMTKCMASDFANKEVRVNSVSRSTLGGAYHDLVEHNGFEIFHVNKMGHKTSLLYTPTGDMIELIKFLISDEARWITGDNYCLHVY